MNKVKNILLVDDDEVTNFYNENLLLKNNFAENIYIANNGAEALKKIEELDSESIHIDIILLDINMPIMNGFEFLAEYEKEFYALKKPIIIFMLTSSSHQKDIESVNKFECVSGYIEKSLTPEKMDNIMMKLTS